MTCDETVMPQDMGMRQVFAVDTYGCSDVTFSGVSDVTLEDMTANKHNHNLLNKRLGTSNPCNT